MLRRTTAAIFNKGINSGPTLRPDYSAINKPEVTIELG